MTPIDEALTMQNKVRLYERRAAESRSKRDAAVRAALADGHTASALAALLDLTESAIRHIGKADR